MGKFKLDTDFSSLKESETNDWILEFRDIAEEAFADSDNHIRLLANLLVMEGYINTINEGLKANDEKLSKVLERASDILWSYLDGHTNPADFQDFANNLFACILAYNTGEDLTDKQRALDAEYFAYNDFSGCEYQAIEWCSTLLLELVSIEGGKIEIDDIDVYNKIDFFGIEEMLNILEDASIDLTDTPKLSNKACDLIKAEEQVHKTELFQQIIKYIQRSLQTALNAASDKFMSLKEEYKKYTIIPKEYSKELLEY